MPDNKTLKQEAMAEVHAVEKILRRWDPIGVRPGIDGGPLDEYDCYAPHIVSMVKTAAMPIVTVARCSRWAAKISVVARFRNRTPIQPVAL